MRRVFMAGVVLCAVGGCGGRSGPPRAAVEGTVTLDGIPIGEGSITFLPTGGTKGPAAGTAIAGGRYRLSAKDGAVVGRNRVQIFAPGKSFKKVRSPFGKAGETIDESAEMVPARYNTESTLECEVKPGNNTLDFDLTTK